MDAAIINFTEKFLIKSFLVVSNIFDKLPLPVQVFLSRYGITTFVIVGIIVSFFASIETVEDEDAEAQK